MSGSVVLRFIVLCRCMLAALKALSRPQWKGKWIFSQWV